MVARASSAQARKGGRREKAGLGARVQVCSVPATFSSPQHCQHAEGPFHSSRMAAIAAAERLVAFLNRAPSPFHAVDAVRTRLAAQGFVEVRDDAFAPPQAASGDA